MSWFHFVLEDWLVVMDAQVHTVLMLWQNLTAVLCQSVIFGSFISVLLVFFWDILLEWGWSS